MPTRVVPAVMCALWLSLASPVLAQDSPDFRSLVGDWTWKPIPTWAAQLTINSVSDEGLVAGVWKDPTWGAIPFTVRAISSDGTIRFQLGRSTKYNLEYDKKDDTLFGPVTNLPPSYTGPEWKTATFRRMK